MLAGNGALKVGSSLLSYLSLLAAPLLPSAPQEQMQRGAGLGQLGMYSQLRLLGVYPFQRWVNMGWEEDSPPSSAQITSFR